MNILELIYDSEYAPLVHLGLISFTVYTIYRYLTRNFNYWSKRGISGPKPVLLFGTTFDDFFGINKSHSEKQWLRKYGKIYGVYSGDRPKLVVSEPELIKDIFIRDFDSFINTDSKRLNQITNKSLGRIDGKDWRRLRPMVSPVLSIGKVRKMYPIINECAKRVTNDLRTQAMNGQEFDIKHVAEEYLLRVMCACTVDMNVNSLDMNDFILNSKRVFDMKLLYEISMTVMPKVITKFFVDHFGSVAELGNEFFIAFGRQLISQMNGFDPRSHHIIDLLSKNYQKFKQTSNEDVFTEEEILGQIWTFFIANYVMTGNTLASLMYELAVNEDVERKLYEELSTAFGESDDIDFDVLSRLPYLDGVVSEALRLHVTSLSVSRITSQDYILGNSGLMVGKSIKLEIPVYAMHLCEEFFPKAESFIPERFMPVNRNSVIPYTYLPFGAGPRICIGVRFATMQMKILLAQVVRKYRIHRTPNTDVPMKLFRHTSGHGPQRVIIGVSMSRDK